MEQVEHLVHERRAGRRRALAATADSFLEQGEVRLAAIVERDHLAVHDGLPRADPGRRGKELPEVPGSVLLAARPEPDAVSVDDSLHAEAVPLHLEQPVGVVERGGDKRRKHRRDEHGLRHRRTLARRHEDRVAVRIVDEAHVRVEPCQKRRSSAVIAGAYELIPHRVDRGAAIDEELELDARAATRGPAVGVVPCREGRRDHELMALAERDLDVAPLLRASREVHPEMAVEAYGPREIVRDQDDHREPGWGHEGSALRSDRGRWLHSGTALAVPGFGRYHRAIVTSLIRLTGSCCSCPRRAPARATARLVI